MAKHNIDYIILYDTREQDLGYVDGLKRLVDKRRKKDGSKFLGVECECVKPLGCTKSTGDISYKYRIDEGEWMYAPFCIEIKKGMDLFSSIHTKASMERLLREFDRAVESNIDMKFVYSDDISKMVEKIVKLQGNGFRKGKLRPNSDVTFMGRFAKLLEELESRSIKHYCCGSNIAYTVRRLVKDDLKKTAK